MAGKIEPILQDPCEKAEEYFKPWVRYENGESRGACGCKGYQKTCEKRLRNAGLGARLEGGIAILARGL